jgi:FMN phosphatase YigB (HAD superfamily)
VLKTLIFDLGNVIVPFDFKRAYRRLEPICKYSAADIPVQLRSTDLVRRFETGKVAPERFVEEISKILDLHMSYEEFCDLFSCIFMPGTLISDSLLAGLHERYRLLLLSNTNHIHFSAVQANYPILRHFDGLVLSHEVGSAKPEPEIYKQTIAVAGCDATECFFTDDILINVEAARQFGMDAVQFKSAGQLEAEFKARGVL